MKKGVIINGIYVLLIAILAVAAIAAVPRMGSSLDNKLTQNTSKMIEKVGADYVPLVQKTPDRYDLLIEASEKQFDLEQDYVFPAFMAQDYFKGYADMNSIKELQLPRDNKAQVDFQFGWYFWSGNYFDENDNEVDIVIVFFRRALYPPPIAHEMGLTDLENQIVQTVVGVNYADQNLHLTGSNPIVSGASGELEFNGDPFLASVGKSTASSHQAGEIFPMKITVDDPEADLKIDLDLNESKPVLLQGDQGKAPDIFGLGTWYYSYPNIKTTGTVTHNGETRTLGGKTWMDHQWMVGISPNGYPKNIFIQALANITNGFQQKVPASFGWDWSDVQFDDDTEITFASPHSVATTDLNNMGDQPPADETRDISGKYINEDGSYENVDGTITINKWMRSDKSDAWYPNGWEAEFPDKKLKFTMTPTVDDQFIYSAGSEIREGGTFVEGTKDGKDVSGYGFGEGVGYGGRDYFLKDNLGILGIEDTPENRSLLSAHPPGAWLVIQSICVLISPLVLLILIIMLIVHYVRKKHRS
ncbi:carotenoid 1,2-hydratase [Patescibacteria group bacterium]|nr:carotenoid 1,2-hydratase [Patescibacteria group bacterium]MBU1673869.1 carotenoid 1,2-hydratase [Patescibacteria group bacterium]MBU1963246.1 carotenoid 1,2-hydratase [Patescibacteria group bacterium]